MEVGLEDYRCYPTHKSVLFADVYPQDPRLPPITVGKDMPIILSKNTLVFP